GWSSARASELEQGVELRGADEVVLRQAPDRMGHVGDAALVVAHGEVGMVVLAVRDPRRGVHEGHGLEVVAETVGLGDRPALERPAVEALEQRARLVGRERGHAALAGLALLAGELVHGRRWIRWTGRSRRAADGRCAAPPGDANHTPANAADPA